MALPCREWGAAAGGDGEQHEQRSCGCLPAPHALSLTHSPSPFHLPACLPACLAWPAVHQYDIVLDVNVINRTGDTMQNVSLELATMGDLKLVERPQAHTLAPGAHKVGRAKEGGWSGPGWLGAVGGSQGSM